MPTCDVHGCKLVPAVTPIRYGYPNGRDLEMYREYPCHERHDLGGCVITPDSRSTKKPWVCPMCRGNVDAEDHRV